MGIEIRPIPGQPGLFLEGATRWTTTRSSGPRPKRRGSRQGLNGLGDLPTRRPPNLVLADGTEGVRYTLYYKQPMEAAQVEALLLPAFAELGYDVLARSAGMLPITWKWEKVEQVDENDKPLAPLYFPVVTTPSLVGESFGFVAGAAINGANDPKKADIEAQLPRSVNLWRVELRPRDEAGVSVSRAGAIHSATRARRAGLLPGSVAGMEIIGVPSAKPKVPSGSWWLLLLGAGAAAAFAIQGKQASLGDLFGPPPVPPEAKCVAWRYEGGKRKCVLRGSDTGFRTATRGFKF